MPPGIARNHANRNIYGALGIRGNSISILLFLMAVSLSTMKRKCAVGNYQKFGIFSCLKKNLLENMLEILSYLN